MQSRKLLIPLRSKYLRQKLLVDKIEAVPTSKKLSKDAKIAEIMYKKMCIWVLFDFKTLSKKCAPQINTLAPPIFGSPNNVHHRTLLGL